MAAATSDTSKKPTDQVESAKRLAARRAVDENVVSPTSSDGRAETVIIGVGSGSTMVYAVERIGEKVREQKHLAIICIPTSHQARNLIISNKLPLGDLAAFPQLDVCIDGADEIDRNLTLIKGAGACQLQEKIVAYNSRRFVVVADFRKYSETLGQQWKRGIPLEVAALSYACVIKTISSWGVQATLRDGAPSKVGPTVTDNGNLVVDCLFDATSMRNPAELELRLRSIPGVVATGLFVAMAQKAYIGNKDGTVTVYTPAH